MIATLGQEVSLLRKLWSNPDVNREKLDKNGILCQNTRDLEFRGSAEKLLQRSVW